MSGDQTSGTSDTTTAATADNAANTASSSADPPAAQTTGQRGDATGSSSNRQAATGNTAERVDDLPEWAQKQIRDLRQEAGSHRTARTAIEQKYQSTLDAIAAGLGLKQDDKPTPEKLQAALNQRDEQLRAMTVERATEKAAIAAQADPELLVPALFHRGKLAGLDPAADDFDAKLQGIVEDAAKDPKFRAGQQFPDLRQGNRGAAASDTADPNAWLRRLAGRQ